MSDNKEKRERAVDVDMIELNFSMVMLIEGMGIRPDERLIKVAAHAYLEGLKSGKLDTMAAVGGLLQDPAPVVIPKDWFWDDKIRKAQEAAGQGDVK